MKEMTSDKSGQTLIEAIIGISVLIAGTVTALALGIMTIRSGQVSQSRTIADNLAREAIEQVRAVRDSNWLADQNAVDGDGNLIWRWDLNLCDEAADLTSARLLMDPVLFTWSIGWSDEPIDEAIVYQVIDPDNSLVYYQQVSDGLGQPANSIPTIYRRLVDIEALPVGTDCVNEVPESYLITATVQWTESGATHQAELTEELFNWRP